MKWKDCKTDEDRWLWHAEIYAFRRLRLGVSPDEHTSPCDPKGEWYNETFIRQACARMQRRPDTNPELAAEGRRILNAWAQQLGYPDYEGATRAGHKWRPPDRHRAPDLSPPAAELGVSVRHHAAE